MKYICILNRRPVSGGDMKDIIKVWIELYMRPMFDFNHNHIYKCVY